MNENKNDINLFDVSKYPFDHRWDQDKNAKLLNIVFQGGTFGNFLKFFLEKFSKLTLAVEATPFTDIGTSHTLKKEQFSGLIQRYHLSFINDNRGENNLPICIILPNTERDFLYLKTAQWFRAGDNKQLPDHLWQKTISENKTTRLNNAVDRILSLYDISSADEYIPKFIVRDWYKLEFLEDITTTHNHRWFKTFSDHSFLADQKTHCFPLESFFNFNVFIKKIKELDSQFGIQLDFDRMDDMRDIFMQGYNLDIYRQQSTLVFDIINNLSIAENMTIPEMDVSCEAFLYAHIEKTNTIIPAPLTNHFFKDTDEIRTYIKNYPNWYKRANPNL